MEISKPKFALFVIFFATVLTTVLSKPASPGHDFSEKVVTMEKVENLKPKEEHTMLLAETLPIPEEVAEGERQGRQFYGGGYYPGGGFGASSANAFASAGSGGGFGGYPGFGSSFSNAQAQASSSGFGFGK